MNWKSSLILVGLGMLVALSVSAFQTSPGYMDADYYFATGLRIAQGKGLTEPFLWNYLGDFSSIPHPSHAYWMPMATFLSALGMILTDNADFLAAKSGFILLAGVIPWIAARQAYKLTGKQRPALLAGLFACFSGFYLPFQTITETFSPYMVLGGLFILTLDEEHDILSAIILGGLAGALHLTRAEGFLWFGIVLICLFLTGTRRVQNYVAALGGYVLVFGPWVLRNLFTFGSFLGPGGMSSLWLTEYNDLFVYPKRTLSFQRWWSRGLGPILQDRIWALGLNLQTLFAVQLAIFLAPLIMWGAWRMRQRIQVKIGLMILALMFFVMTFVFPFQGARGGYFHGGAGVQTFLWALAGIGFSEFIAWGTAERSWNRNLAWNVLGTGFVLVSLFVTGVVTWKRVIGSTFQNPVWDSSYKQHLQIEKTLNEITGTKAELVMLNNPPGYFAATGKSSIVIPDGNVGALLNAARTYGVKYLILDQNHPQDLSQLYKTPENNAELKFLITQNGVHYFSIGLADEQ